ncbi:MAG: CDP-alcohol phosphatidyltransferase family protein, partial [Dongiaceae bacterium]
MSVPNIITIARILTVPLTIWLIVTGRYDLAFWIFIIAGISDGVD